MPLTTSALEDLWVRPMNSRHPAGGASRPLAVRVSADVGQSRLAIHIHAVPEDPSERETFWHEFRGGRDLGAPSLFAIHSAGDALIVTAEAHESQFWSRSTESVVRAWAADVLPRAGLRFELRGHYEDAAWPPKLWRRTFRQRDPGGGDAHFGYFVDVQPDRKRAGASVLLVASCRLPTDDADRNRRWTEELTDLDLRTRRIRDAHGLRSIFLPCERAAPVGEAERKLIVGPRDEKAVWTPHTLAVVKQWHASEFAPRNYELQIHGKTIERE